MNGLRTLRISLLALGVFGAAGGLTAEELELPENPRRSISRNSYFEVVADDPVSAQFAAAVGQLLAERVLRIVPTPGGGRQPVLVDLQPLSRYEGESQFVTEIYPSGQIKLTIAWGEITTRDILERALAQGFLTDLAAGYSEGALTVPLWLELAVQHLARVKTVSSHRWALAERLKESAPMTLEAILNAQRGDGSEEDLGTHAFWLISFLETEAKGRGALQGFIVRLFRGENPMEALEASFAGPLRSVQEAEMWWLVGRNEMVRSSGTPMWSAQRSRDRVMELARLTFLVEGRQTRLFADDLWDYWQSKTLEAELDYRIRVVGVESAFVHVFYQNAILSLNQLFQAVVEGDKEAYREARLAFRHDLRTGDELLEETASVLDDLQAELKSREE